MRHLIKLLIPRYLFFSTGSVVAAWSILVISLSITIFISYNVKKDTEREALQHFQIKTDETKFAIRQRMLAYEYLLRGGAGLFAGSDLVEREEWQAYISSLKINEAYPGIQGIGFSKRILPFEREAHIRRIRSEGLPDYSIWPEGERPEYTSIIYLEPYNWRNKRAIGYDMFSEPVRRLAMEKARDTGVAAMTGKVRLVQETDEKGQAGFLIYIPIYNHGEPTNTVEERRVALAGYVYSPFRMNDLMQGILGQNESGIDLRIYDGTEISDRYLMYYNSEIVKSGDLEHRSPLFSSAGTIEINGHTWTLVFSSLPAFEQARERGQEYNLLMAGIIISLLLFAFVWSQATTKARAVDLADKMTKELRKSERRFFTLLQASPVGVFYEDKNGNCTYVNDQWCKITGMRPDEALGKGWIKSVHPDDKERVIKDLEQSIWGSMPFKSEYRYLLSDGTEVWVYGQSISLKDTDGKFAGNVGTIIDITERKNAVEELNRAADENIKLQAQILHGQKLESLGVLAGGIAHDFNNLLMSILGHAEIALHDLPYVSNVHKSVEKIREVAQRAADLTKQMLAYSGKGKFVIEPIDLTELVGKMAELLQVSIKKNVHIIYNLMPGLPLVDADATQIRQVVMNLIINASDAIGNKPGVVIISTGVMECNREYLDDAEIGKDSPEMIRVYIDVTDNGCGMNEETKTKIFDPFFTTKFTGRGLGLAAVLGIVRGHKGALKVKSKPGEGSTFRVLLPKSDKFAAANQTDTMVADWQGRGTILIVDDDYDILDVTKMMLEKNGFSTLSATDGRSGVELFRTHTAEIKAVLLDLTMPDMSGEEAFREMKTIRSDVKVVLCSGYNEEEVTPRFSGDVFTRFLQKPYTLSDLMYKLRDILE